METDELKLDGNAAAGALREVFAVEVTAALSTCASCSAVTPLGALGTYVQAPGLVLRCVRCGAVMLRVVRAGSGRTWLDPSGVSCLELAAPAG